MLFTVNSWVVNERIAFTLASAAESLVAWGILRAMDARNLLVFIQTGKSSGMKSVFPSGLDGYNFIRVQIVCNDL